MTYDVTECRIVQRTTNWTGANHGIAAHNHGKGHPFSEIFIVANGQHYYSRTWEVLTDSPHSRTYQIEAFKRRMAAAERSHA